MTSASPDAEVPGDDDLDYLIAEYVAAMQGGEAVDRAAWLARHPDHSEELQAFFEDYDRFRLLGTPLPLCTVDPFGLVGMRLGDYEIEAEVARGGMGAVLRALQVSVGRRVALKLVLGGRLASAEERQRFKTEATTAARLNHPHIVPVFDVGELEGRPYYTMPFLEGGSLAERVAEFTTAPRNAASLMVSIARAVHFAHDAGILHRDVKPSNILFDTHGTPRLADFGLAKDEDSSRDLTRLGAVLGTAEYVAPEATQGKKPGATRAADIYSLGAVLYEILTSVPPFRGATPVETLEMARKNEPVPPRRLNRRVARDLQSICLKCLEKDPRRRYPTALEVAEDLERWIQGKPTRARSASGARRLVKWAIRHPTPSIAGLLTAAAVIAVLSLSLRHSAELGTSLTESRHLLFASEMTVAHQAWKDGQVERLRSILLRNVPSPGTPDLRGFEWYHLLWRANSLLMEVNEGRSSRRPSLALHPGAELIAVGNGRGEVVIRKTSDFASRSVLSSEPAILAVTFSPGGELLAAASGDTTGNHEAGPITVWEWTAGKKLFALPAFSCEARAIAFLDDDLLAIGSVEGEVKLLDARSGEQRGSFLVRGAIRCIKAASPTTLLVAVGANLESYEVPGGALRGRFRERSSQAIGCFDVSPNHEQIAIGRIDGTVSAFRGRANGLESLNGFGAELSQAHIGVTAALAYSADGSTLAWGLSSRRLDPDTGDELVILDAATLAELGAVRRPQGVSALLFLHGGGQLLTSEYESLRLWDLARLCEPALLTPPKGRFIMDIAPDGRRFAMSEEPASVHIYDLGTLNKIMSFETGVGRAIALAHDAAGKRLAVGGERRAISMWDLESRRCIAKLAPHLGQINSIAFDPEGVWLAAGTFRQVKLWDLRTQKAATLEAHRDVVANVAFVAGGKKLITHGRDDLVKVWSVPDWNLGATFDLRVHHIKPSGFAISPVRPWFACSYKQGDMEIWNYSNGEHVRRLAGDGTPIGKLAFSPDGISLASGNANYVVTLWDLDGGRERMVLDIGRRSLSDLAFTDDGRTLAVAEWKGNVQFWHAAGPDDVLKLQESIHVVKPAQLAATGPGQAQRASGPFQWTDLDWAGMKIAGGCWATAWADYDMDGDLDLFLAMNGPDRLFDNESGTLVEHTPALFTEDDDTSGAVWLDCDRDGDLDLLLSHRNSPSRLFINGRLGGFSEAYDWVVNGAPNAVSATPADFDRDGDPDLYINLSEGVDCILKNNGLGRFERLPDEATQLGRDLGNGVWGDYDQDGFPDLYLGSHRTSDLLLHNDGGGGFTNVTSAVLGTPVANRLDVYAGAWGDADNDGDLDLFVSRRSRENRFYLNQDGQLMDTKIAPLNQRGFSRGAFWCDFDCDGDLDLFVTDESKHNRILRNDGVDAATGLLAFIDVSSADIRSLGSIFCASTVDYDGDGDVDILAAEVGGPVHILRNDNVLAGHWLGVRLEGKASDRWGLGTRVRIVAAGKEQIREVGAACPPGSVPPVVHFGLGEAEKVEELEVRWASGREGNIEELRSNEVETVTEPEE